MKVRRVVWWSAAAIPLGLLAAGLIAYWRSPDGCAFLNAGAPAHPMKAIVYCGYGSPDVLRLQEVEKPAPGPDEVLVKVRAAAVNPLDWHYVRGTPYIMRLDAGLRRPKVARLGVDFAGIVEAVGTNVTEFRPGDEVFGGRNGAFAQYLCVRQDRAIARKPPRVSFEQAASVAVAGTTALQGLRDAGKIRAGDNVLINGASGGVGTFAVQIAKSFGAHVTGVCGTKNVDLVRSLGADQVIDYTRQDFTQTGRRYDLMLDNVGNRSLAECRQVLNPKGRYVLIGGGGPKDSPWLGPFPRAIHAMLLSRFVSQDVGMFLSQLKKQDLAALADLMQAGKVTPAIDRSYKLSEVPQALTYLEQGHARAKVVITVE